MLTESIALSCCGAALGLLLAFAGTRALARLDAISIPLLQNVRIDATALAFTLVMALATGLIFGLAPALQVPATALHDVLKDTSRGSTEGKRGSWIRSALVVSEIAFACVLLVGAGLLIRSFLRVLNVSLGFRPERAATLRVDPDRQHLTKAQENSYFDEVLRRVRAVPGIEAAGLTDSLPLGVNRSWGAPAKGQVYPKGKFPTAFVRIISDGYLPAMGIPVRAGRNIAEGDTPATEPVIVINETMARTLYPGESALGKIVRADRERRVVGVAGDVRHLALEQGAGMEMYLTIRQTRDISAVNLVVRTTLAPAEMAAGISRRAQAHRAEPGGQRIPAAAQSRRQSSLAPALRSAVARRIRTVRPGSCLAGNLRRHLVLGQPQNVGNRNPHGPGRLRPRPADAHPHADSRPGRGRDAGRSGRLLGARARTQRFPVRSDFDRSRNLPRYAGRPHGGGGVGRLSAGAPRLAGRSDGGAAGELTPAIFRARARDEDVSWPTGDQR